MAFEAKDYSIGDILNKAVYSIPRNQRRYVWDKENWQDLFEDIVFSIQQKKPHFMGSIVLEDNGKKSGLSYYTIIDGQQRLTTITLFLIAIMKHFVEQGMNDDFLGTVSYLRTTNNRNQEEVILNSDYHMSLERLVNAIISLDNPTLPISAFVNTNILSSAKDKRIGEAVRFFYHSIKEDIDHCDNIQERLGEIRNTVLEMTVVKIISTSEEDSYTIFEILNARGQELEPHELLKNYIMRYIQPAERRDNAKQKWEEMEHLLGAQIKRFVKHYSTHRFGDTKNKYNSPYEAIQKATRGEDINVLFDDIKLKSEYYYRIVHPTTGMDGNCTEVEARIFGFFHRKRFEQFRPILLSLIHQKELEKITIKQYEYALRYIYVFFVCYSIIGEERANKLEDVVFKYARLIEDSYSDTVLNDFADELKRKLPGYDWFLNAFRNIGWSKKFDFYNSEKNKNRAQIVLEVIEQYLSQQNTVHEFTIEHLYPDSEAISNSQIGNLIPLEESINRNCKDKKLEEKYPFYERSCFATTRGIVQRYRGKEFDPAKRTDFLAQLVYNNILQLNQLDYANDK